jgi:hypothetical protein
MKLIKYNYLTILALMISYSFCNAAPHPATSSSSGLTPEKGLFFARKGFIFPAPKHWTLDEDLREESTDEFSIEYKSKSSQTATLSLKTDSLKKNLSLESYGKKWMKDYSSYGFDLLGAKPFVNDNKAKGLVVDLKHRKKNQQLRQVIFLQNKTAVTLTCVDEIKNFINTIADCNSFFKNFSWIPEQPEKSVSK